MYQASLEKITTHEVRLQSLNKIFRHKPGYVQQDTSKSQSDMLACCSQRFWTPSHQRNTRTFWAQSCAIWSGVVLLEEEVGPHDPLGSLTT